MGILLDSTARPWPATAWQWPLPTQGGISETEVIIEFPLDGRVSESEIAIEIEFPPRGGIKGGVTKPGRKQVQAIPGPWVQYKCDSPDGGGGAGG